MTLDMMSWEVTTGLEQLHGESTLAQAHRRDLRLAQDGRPAAQDAPPRGATHWLDVNLRAGGGDDYVFLTRFFRSLLERLAPGTSLQTRRFPTPGGGYQS